MRLHTNGSFGVGNKILEFRKDENYFGSLESISEKNISCAFPDYNSLSM